MVLKRGEIENAEPVSPDAGGEWLVEPDAGGIAVKAGTDVAAVFTDQWRACLAAAALPQTDRGTIYRQVRRDDGAYDVTLESQRRVGRLRTYNPELLEALHVLEGIVSSPAALARLLEAARCRDDTSNLT